MTAAADRAAVAAALWERLLAAADALDPGDWRLPTPCDGWSVQDLLAHCAGMQVAFDGGAQPRPPDGWEPPAGANPRDAWTEAGVAARRGWSPARVRDELGAAKAGHVARLRGVSDWDAATDGPVGRTTEATLFATRCYDLWVHLQDLRTAVGQPVEHDDGSDEARVAHGYPFGLLGWLFVKKAGARERATLRVALGAPLDVDTVVEVSLGRGRLNPDADPGDCAVVGAPSAFTLLVSGRDEPETYREQGHLDWSGARGEAFVRRARLFA
ncbi:maleylpyruvate isomerase family mycothiol-dependent enzyme [soil metagenome]